MINKHFLKTLLIFTAMIILGLIGVFLVSYFDQQEAENSAQAEHVAK